LAGVTLVLNASIGMVRSTGKATACESPIGATSDAALSSLPSIRCHGMSRRGGGTWLTAIEQARAIGIVLAILPADNWTGNLAPLGSTIFN
jgi:PhoPQ-activated pathogenicity-related protein